MPRGMSGWLLLPWNVPTGRSRLADGPLSSGRGGSQCLAECLVGCFCHGMCRLAAAAWRTVPSPQGEGAVSASRNVWLAASAMECADWPQPLAGRSPLLGERVRVRAESINPGRIFPATPRRWPGFVHLRHHPSAPDGSASEMP